MVDIVDEEDNVIDTVPKQQAHDMVLLHRGAAALVFNSKGGILVHKRASIKGIYPGFYDMFVGGWVQHGEDYREAAMREVEEEVGIKDPDLRFLFKHRYTCEIDDYFVEIFSCIYDGGLKLQEDEVAEAYFVTIDQLEGMFKTKEFCPDSLEIFNEYKRRKEKGIL